MTASMKMDNCTTSRRMEGGGSDGSVSKICFAAGKGLATGVRRERVAEVRAFMTAS